MWCLSQLYELKMLNLKSSDIPKIRSEILKEQNYTCPLCGKHITEQDRITLDHQHKQRKSDNNGENGNGQVRGVLCADCNVSEGKIWNSTSRFQGARTPQDRINWLRKLIEYYSKDPYPYIHPTEVQKEPELSKKNFNILLKRFKEKYPKKKPIEYPKSKKMTATLKPLYEEFEINPYNGTVIERT